MLWELVRNHRLIIFNLTIGISWRVTIGGNTTNKDLEHRIEGLEKILENSQRDNYKIHQETQAVIVESEKKNHQLAKDSMNSMMEKLFKQV